MSETFFDTCVNWSCVTRRGCRTSSSTLFTVQGSLISPCDETTIEKDQSDGFWMRMTLKRQWNEKLERGIKSGLRRTNPKFRFCLLFQQHFVPRIRKWSLTAKKAKEVTLPLRILDHNKKFRHYIIIQMLLVKMWVWTQYWSAECKHSQSYLGARLHSGRRWTQLELELNFSTMVWITWEQCRCMTSLGFKADATETQLYSTVV